MSYAEQFFGVKETEVMAYVNDLAWFGKDSYVYSSSDLMGKIISSARGLQNPVANFYIYLWAKENGESVASLFKPGFKISLYNKDLGYAIPFVLFRAGTDNSQEYADFITEYPAFYGVSSGFEADTSGQNILNFEDYTFNEYLNGTKSDWFEEFAAYNSAIDPTFKRVNVLKKLPGFCHGLLDDVLEELIPYKTLADNTELRILLPSADDFTEAMTNLGISVATFVKCRGKLAYRFINKVIEANGGVREDYIISANSYVRIKTGDALDIQGSSEVTADQTAAAVNKAARDGITGYTVYNAAAALSTSGIGGILLTTPGGKFAKIRL